MTECFEYYTGKKHIEIFHVSKQLFYAMYGDDL